MTPDGVEAELVRQFSGIGLKVMRFDRATDPSGDVQSVIARFIGRTPMGHGEEQYIVIPVGHHPDARTAVSSRLVAQMRYHQRVGGFPPVLPTETMPLDHLLVSRALANRIAIDHPGREADTLRTTVLAIIDARGARVEKTSRPYDAVAHGNRIDHRETFIGNVSWKGNCLVVRNVDFPRQTLEALIGMPPRIIIDHPVLEAVGTISAIRTDANGAESTTTVFDVEQEWLPGNRL